MYLLIYSKTYALRKMKGEKMREKVKYLVEGLSLVSVFFGIGGLAGAIENDTNWVIPIICLVAGFGILMILENGENAKVHDCTTDHDSEFRLHFLH